jgi:hypothetical protein
MDKEKWRERYIDRMVFRGVDRDFAVEVYQAAIDDHEYDEDPEHSADEELSCWGD